VGTYEVAVAHPGFAKLVRSGIELLTEHTVDLNLVLKVGEATQSVVVDAPAPLVQATTSDVQTTIAGRQMSELPLNGRNAFQLAVLVPGAVQTQASTTVGQQDNDGLSVNGLRPPDLSWQLDGGTYVNKNYGSAPTPAQSGYVTGVHHDHVELQRPGARRGRSGEAHHAIGHQPVSWHPVRVPAQRCDGHAQLFQRGRGAL
jgi:hypothetical protein